MAVVSGMFAKLASVRHKAARLSFNYTNNLKADSRPPSHVKKSPLSLGDIQFSNQVKDFQIIKEVKSLQYNCQVKESPLIHQEKDFHYNYLVKESPFIQQTKSLQYNSLVKESLFFRTNNVNLSQCIYSDSGSDSKNKDGKGKFVIAVSVGAFAAGGLVLGDQNDNQGDSEMNDNNANNDVVEVDSDASDENAPAKKKQKESDDVLDEKVEQSGTAPVWKYATKCSDNKSAKCNICKGIYKMPQGNTSNIRDHIILKHSNIKEGRELKELTEKKRKKLERKRETDEKEKEQKSIKNFFSADRGVSKAKKDTIDNTIVEFFIADHESFSTVENHFFKQMCFSLNSGYILPSRRELVRHIDEKIEKVKVQLTKEINNDIKSHKSIHITSDGGNSGDMNKTKKNTLTVSRINDNWEFKTDTVAVPEAKGSQTGVVLRNQWKEELLKIGYDSSWKVSATTDAAKNERSARGIGRHDEIGLDIKFEADCTDHQIQLLAKDSRKNMDGLKTALKKGRKLVTHFSKSTLSRQLLTVIQKELNLPVKWILVGTKNRWFFEMSEAERLVELRVSIEEFQNRRQPGDGRRAGDDGEEEDEDVVVPDQFNDEDFIWLETYVKAMKPFTAISKFLGGERYPTGGSVIPALEQIRDDLEKLKQTEKDDEAQELLENMLKNMDKRFKDNWKMKLPFNCLTFLDPRYVDLYCLEEEVFNQIKNNIIFDSVFTEAAANHPLVVSEEPTPAAGPSGLSGDKRAVLLQKKLARSKNQVQENANTFEAKVEEEINRYREIQPINPSENPLVWWRLNETGFPLLSKYVKANGAFQATSVASERIYNVDKLVYDDRRKSISVDRGSGLVVAQDFLKRRINKKEFELCEECPKAQHHNQSKYRISCKAHNQQ